MPEHLLLVVCKLGIGRQKKSERREGGKEGEKNEARRRTMRMCGKGKAGCRREGKGKGRERMGKEGKERKELTHKCDEHGRIGKDKGKG